MVFRIFRESVFFVVKTNETNRKYSSVRSFWYHSQLLTPNSLRERSDGKRDFAFVCDQCVMEVECEGTVLGLLRSHIGHKQMQSPIFHLTVLEGYWELEAENGTRITARNCTFCSFR